MVRALAPPPYPEDSADKECYNEARIDTILRYKLLACDQRSFLTGSAVADLEPAHIFEPIRKDKVRKDEVEEFLTQQRFHNPQSKGFVLDSVENTILLESSLHVQWRDYGTFCFVPAKEDAIEMPNSLHRSNALWQEEAYRNPKHCLAAPFCPATLGCRPHFPHLLLPEFQTLAIAKDQPIHVPGGPVQGFFKKRCPDWTYWVAGSDSLALDYNIRQDIHTSWRLPPFLSRDARAELGHPPVSSLAMIVNAQSKIQQYAADNAHRPLDDWPNLLSELVAAILFVPKGIDNEAQSSQVAKAFRPHEGKGTTDESYYPNEVEVALLWKKATDPFIEKKERSDAAMKLMFYCHQLPK
ncbi:hypothetical protein BDN70DRAFT_929027 [Pholiota conissans]|uniref:Uncharacterized protein n=1 Tax=Pholiota conissans TaxID=109636 RepID=A0A9P5Z8Z5_9AGAR|nr:hypothetical protein BDN70DRAFT_929027 [Pholiota conissans]